MGYPVQLNNTASPLRFMLVLSTDHITGATGVTPTVLIAKDTGAFAAPIGAITEVSNGWYQIAANAIDANTLGPILLHATATGCDPRDDQFYVVDYDPTAFTATSVAASSSPSITARALIARTLKIIGVLAQGETPSDAEEQDAFQSLNDLVGTWATDGLTPFTLTRTVYPVTATASRTIGESGSATIAAVRPMSIAAAGWLLDSGTELQLRLPSGPEYAQISDKAQTSTFPSALYYNPTVPDGTLTLWPVAAGDLVLYVPTSISRFANLTSAYNIPPGYVRALRYNLAVDLAPEFGKPPDPEIHRLAAKSLSAIKLHNSVVPRITTHQAGVPGGRGGGFDWLTGRVT